MWPQVVKVASGNSALILATFAGSPSAKTIGHRRVALDDRNPKATSRPCDGVRVRSLTTATPVGRWPAPRP